MQNADSCATSSRIQRTAKYASETQHSLLAATQAVKPRKLSGPPAATLTAFPLTF